MSSLPGLSVGSEAAAGTEHCGPRVSLCTVTHNRPQLLSLLAQCVAEQDYPPHLLEWVIIDDSNSDLVPDLSPVHQAGISLRHVCLAERIPLGAKRNLCHDHACGDLLVLMDDDDYYPPSRVAEAVAVLCGGKGDVAGCPRMPLLLLPEGSLWLTPSFHPNDATANTLAYRRAYFEAGHRFDPEAWQSEEVAFLERFTTPLLPLDPRRSLTCIGHGSNTVDKRLWIARNGAHWFERLPADAPAFPPRSYLQRYCQVLGLRSPSPLPASPAATAGLPEAEAPGERLPWRVAVVTPYRDEPLPLLRRCHASVLRQDYPCTHLLVADGPGQNALASWECRHIVLGVGHADNGNTPRCLGALAAMNEGYDCIAFLDVDNWLAPDHLSRAIATQATDNCDVVFSRRHIVFPDGRRLTLQLDEEQGHRHADTSCMVLFEPAFSSLALWAQMPRHYAPQCDRLMFQQLMARHRCGWSEAATLYFETWYAGHFLAAGLLPPRNAKFLMRHPAAVWREAAEAFRRRSPTPLYPGDGGVGPDKPRLNLVTILGPARSGGTLLQSLLCRHLGFEGIPENQVLYQCVARLGRDVRARYAGEKLRGLLREPLSPDRRLKAHDLQHRGWADALKPDRSYTLLEAYFRAIQALTPPQVMAFAKAYGQVTVLDRSCTLPLVAEVLFDSLPDHRAVLMLRDPLQQMAAVRRMMQRYPGAWSMPDPSPQALCELYLESLAKPLRAAPVGQLLLVSHGRLLRQPRFILEAVAGWLGLEANSFYALEALDLGPDHWLNRAHEQDWQRQLQALPGQLLRQEPWKQDSVAMAMGLDPFSTGGEAFSPEPLSAEAMFSAAEREELAVLLNPLRQRVRALEANEAPQLEPLPQSEGRPELVALVEEVVIGLERHREQAAIQ